MCGREEHCQAGEDEERDAQSHIGHRELGLGHSERAILHPRVARVELHMDRGVISYHCQGDRHLGETEGEGRGAGDLQH